MPDPLKQRIGRHASVSGGLSRATRRGVWVFKTMVNFSLPIARAISPPKKTRGYGVVTVRIEKGMKAVLIKKEGHVSQDAFHIPQDVFVCKETSIREKFEKFIKKYIKAANSGAHNSALAVERGGGGCGVDACCIASTATALDLRGGLLANQPRGWLVHTFLLRGPRSHGHAPVALIELAAQCK